MAQSERPSVPAPSGTLSLPPRPELQHLKNQAKRRLEALRRSDPKAKLSTAQFALARDYGFSSWRELKAHVDAACREDPSAGDDRVADLERALDAGDAARMRAVLDASPSLIDHIGGPWTQPLLHRAAYAGHAAVVDLLLERGVDVNQRDKNDNAYALHFAAERGLPIVKRLVEAGGDVHGDGDEHELGVLGWATCFGEVHRDVAEYLIERGAEPHLFSAIALGMAERVREMLHADRSRAGQTMSKHEHHRTALMHAAKCGRPEMVALLLEYGADPAATDDAGQTAMTFATDRAVIARLKDAGAELDLLGALNSGAFGAAEALLKKHPGRLGPQGSDRKALH
ncbi:MAG: ankyrin repeat domain-containing protein, partial [Planctomycetota bacterium]